MLWLVHYGFFVEVEWKRMSQYIELRWDVFVTRPAVFSPMLEKGCCLPLHSHSFDHSIYTAAAASATAAAAANVTPAASIVRACGCKCVHCSLRSYVTYVDTIHTDTLVCTADLTWNFLRFLSSMMIGKRGSILLWNDMCYMNIFGRFCAYVSWFSSSTSSHALALENARTSTHIRSRLCRWAVTVDHFATTII